MDARPQRPLRSTRNSGDENVPVIQKEQSALQHKNKSTGTLSSMLAVGGLKAAAKRTAFGDVSNTAKSLNVNHEEAVITGKSIYQDVVKPIPTQDKPAALSRPAQRPLNINGSKQSLHPLEQVSIAPLAKPAQPPQNKRTLTKKAPMIYKDAATEVVQPQTSNSIVPSQQHGPRQTRSQPEITVEHSSLHPIDIRDDVEVIATIPKSNINIPDDTIYHDVSQQPLPLVPAAKAVDLKALAEEEQAAQAIINQQKAQRQLPALPAEPEEYWEEDSAEVYDEQGYTTAHSYRSRGENTTGGATTVILPKITQKIKKELDDAKILIETSRTADEIEDEMWDTSMVAEYGDEIFSYMRELENKLLPDPHYMDTQAEIQWSMRSVLMDWLIQVHHRFSLLPETLFLCVNYIDRFLSKKVVSLGKLQLVGATAIFVAAKYEEINCPSIGEIVYMVDGGYTADEILKAERFMLSMLQFELGWPGPMSFLRRISKADDYDLETRTLAKYFLEVTIMDERFVGSPPSFVAAAAHGFARLMLNKGDWSPAHVYYSGYTWAQLKPLVALIMECCENARKHHAAVFDKYADRRYKRASTYVEDQMIKGFTIPGTHRRSSVPANAVLESQYPMIPFDPLLSIEENSQRMVQARS